MKLECIFALLGAILLSGFFILVVVLAAMGAPKNHLTVATFPLVSISIMLYAMGPTIRVLKPSDPSEGMDGDAKQTLLDTTDADLKDEL